MFSMNAEEVYAKRYLKMGVMGYLTKDAPISEIKKAIETVLNNMKYVSPELTEKLISDLHSHHESENPFDKLSPREFEIVQHLANGDSVSEISGKSEPAYINHWNTQVTDISENCSVIILLTLIPWQKFIILFLIQKHDVSNILRKRRPFIGAVEKQYIWPLSNISWIIFYNGLRQLLQPAIFTNITFALEIVYIPFEKLSIRC